MVASYIWFCGRQLLLIELPVADEEEEQQAL